MGEREKGERRDRPWEKKDKERRERGERNLIWRKGEERHGKRKN